MKKILATNIRPLRFEGHLVLTLDPRWDDLFDGKLEFEAYFTDGKLVIQSK